MDAQEPGVTFTLRLRLHRDEPFFGPGVARVLELTDEHASLRKAAQSMGMAYSKAFRIVKRCEACLGYPVLSSSIGGKGGGGSKLTEPGRAFIQKYRAMERDVQRYAGAAFERTFAADVSSGTAPREGVNP